MMKNHAPSLCLEKARRIWTNDNPDAEHVWITARKQFKAASPASAWIEIAADLRYFLRVNDQPVGFGPPKFHQTTPTVDRYEIGQWLKEGDNVVTIQVYSYGNRRDLGSCMPKSGALWAVIGVDGREIPTDASWEVRRERGYVSETARRSNHQPPAEVFDARVKPDEWQAATVLESEPLEFELRDIPPFNWSTHAPDRVLETGRTVFSGPVEGVKDVSARIAAAGRFPERGGQTPIRRGLGGAVDQITLDASQLPPTEGAYALFDFGRLWTGYPVITITGTPGTVVDISYAEHLLQGRVDPTKHELNYTDRLILGDGPLTHRITWPKCFRYAQIDVRGGSATVKSLAMERSAYPVERIGSFACSDAALDQAWEISAHTVELCMEDGFMDTPWRERGSWLGDDVIAEQVNYAVFGDTSLVRRFLLHHVRGQQPNGQMNGKYPGWTVSRLSTWSLTFLVSVREYLSHSDDPGFAAQILPAVSRVVGWLSGYRLPEGIYGNLPLTITREINIYNVIDWAPMDTSGANAAWNVHAYAGLRSAALVAEQAGDAKSAAAWNAQADELRSVFSKYFWDDAKGVYVNGWKDGQQIDRWGCQENYLAIGAGLCTDAQRERIIARLKQENLLAFFTPTPDAYDQIIEGLGDGNFMVAIGLNCYRWDSRKMVPLGTPYFTQFALQALLDLGMTEDALTMIGKFWGEYSRQGSTSTWETWTRDAGTHSHGWGSAPAFVLGKYILGVRSSTSADADVEIFPQSGGLTWARGRVNTPHGVVQASWSRDGDKWKLEVDAPEGCRVIAGLPGSVKQRGATPIVRHGIQYAAIRADRSRFTLESEK